MKFRHQLSLLSKPSNFVGYPQAKRSSWSTACLQMSALELCFQFVSSSLAKGDEFLNKVFVTTHVSNVDLQKRFPVVQINSMCHVPSVCRSLAQSADLESLLIPVVEHKHVAAAH